MWLSRRSCLLRRELKSYTACTSSQNIIGQCWHASPILSLPSITNNLLKTRMTSIHSSTSPTSLLLPPPYEHITGKSHTMAGLHATPRQIALFPQFIAAQPETIVLKEKVMSLSGDSFSIKLANGTPILQVEGTVLSLSGKKKVTDIQGKHLFTIGKNTFIFMRRMWSRGPAARNWLR
jgi:hypothetical protein